MKVKVLLVGLLATSVCVSTAVAAPPAGKGKPATTGDACKPKVTVVLKGALTAVSTGSLSMTVTGGNRWARAYVTAGSASVTLNESTKVRRHGKKSATDLAVGDRVLVQARACKADLEAVTPPALTAARVVAHPAKA
jgi:hypothetical protein